MEESYTLQELATMLRVHHCTIRKMIKANPPKIEHYRVSNRIRFKKSIVDEFIAKQTK